MNESQNTLTQQRGNLSFDDLIDNSPRNRIGEAVFPAVLLVVTVVLALRFRQRIFRSLKQPGLFYLGLFFALIALRHQHPLGFCILAATCILTAKLTYRA